MRWFDNNSLKPKSFPLSAQFAHFKTLRQLEYPPQHKTPELSIKTKSMEIKNWLRNPDVKIKLTLYHDAKMYK